MPFLSVLKNGQKKNPDSLFVVGAKRKNSVKKMTRTHQVFHQFLQLDHIAFKSGSSEAFRFLCFLYYFSFLITYKEEVVFSDVIIILFCFNDIYRKHSSKIEIIQIAILTHKWLWNI